MEVQCLTPSASGFLPSATALRQPENMLASSGKNRYDRFQTRFGNSLPCTTKFLLKPSLKYLADSAILSRLGVAVARVWMNRPSNVKDPRFNIDQKRQGFFERAMVELFGTPAYMLVMHATQDMVGTLLQKAGCFTPVLKVNTLTHHQLQRANQVLEGQMGKTGVWGRVIFEPKETSFTYYLAQLDKVGLGELKHNPAFMKAAEGWFKRTKIGTSLTVLGGIICSGVFGGVFIQKMNDQWFAPMIARRLRNHEDLHLSDKDLTLKV